MAAKKRIVVDRDGYKRLLAACFHWFRVAHDLRGNDEWIGSDDCALCARWFNASPACTGCPIQQHTGRDSCVKTPHGEALRAAEWHGPKSRQFRAAGRKMLAYLCDLAERVEVAE